MVRQEVHTLGIGTGNARASRTSPGPILYQIAAAKNILLICLRTYCCYIDRRFLFIKSCVKMSDCYADIPDEVLDSTWKDSDLARLAMHIVSWEKLAPLWGLTEVEEEEIKRDNPKYAAQKISALRQWKVKSQDAATYRQLVRVFSRLGDRGLVDKVREIVLTPEEVPASVLGDILSSYQEFLRKNYVQLPHPGMLGNQWPIMNTPSYVQLPLSKLPKPPKYVHGTVAN